MEKRQHPRHEFEFLVLEHRPEDVEHPQGPRMLHCIDFSASGMRLRGAPRFDRFRATLCVPHDGSRVDADLEVVHKGDGYFGVRFVDPSAELNQKLEWWQAPADPGQNADIDV